MDTLVNAIVAQSQGPDLQQLVNYLKGAEAVMSGAQFNCLAAAQHLDPSLHSLGIVILLNTHAKKPNFNLNGGFVEYTSNFLCNCAAQQIQQVPDHFVELCRKFKEQLLAPNMARLGIMPLLAALQRLSPGPRHLTPLHADILQLCLLAKTYSAAAPLVAAELTEVDPTRTAIKPTDVLLYCYYGGMVATGRKQLSRALELFLQGLAAPTMVCSAITSAIYKKYVLVSLLHAGSVRPLPRFTSPKVRSLLDQPDMKAYSDITTAYGSDNPEKLLRVAEQHMTVFSNDNNVGLVKQVLTSRPMRTIQRLTQTYVTLSLADIARAAGLQGAEEAEAMILKMVSCRQVFAQINGRDGMVTFLQDPQQYAGADVARRIDSTIQSVTTLSAQVQAVQDKLVLDKAYYGKLLARERGAGAVGALGSLDADYGAGLYGA